jgi:hypothetical protein
MDIDSTSGGTVSVISLDGWWYVSMLLGAKP